MKKFLLFFILFVSLGVSARDYKLVMLEPIQNETCVFNGFSFSISFEWSEYENYGVTVIVKNESDSRIYVEWENARIEDEPICFGTDNSFSYRDRKPDEVVHSGSRCKRFIARQSQFKYEGRELFHKKWAKERGISEKVVIIIPVRSGEKVKDYRFTLAVKPQ